MYEDQRIVDISHQFNSTFYLNSNYSTNVELVST